MFTFKRGNALKATGVLVALMAMLAAMTLGPTLSEPKAQGPEINVPAMHNVPPNGSFSIELQ